MESLISETKDTLPTEVPQTLEELDAIFLDQQQAVQRNLYFFLHYAQLSQISPEICQKQHTRYGTLLKKFRLAFQNLQKTGLFRAELFPGEYDNMINTLYMSIIYWAPFMELKKSIHTEYQRYAWRSIYHLMTEKGCFELQAIIQI